MLDVTRLSVLVAVARHGSVTAAAQALLMRSVWQLSRVEPYGFFILLALLFIPVGGQSVLRMILAPPVTLVHRMVSGLAGL